MDDQKKANSCQAALSLSACVAQYFHHRVAAEQGIRIRVEREDPQPSMESRGCRCGLHFTLPDGTLLQGALRVENVGGNMYTVEASAGGSRSRAFSVCLVTASVNAEDSSGRYVCEFLLDELKRTAGEQWLRKASAQAAAPSRTFHPTPN